MTELLITRNDVLSFIQEERSETRSRLDRILDGQASMSSETRSRLDRVVDGQASISDGLTNQITKLNTTIETRDAIASRNMKFVGFGITVIGGFYTLYKVIPIVVDLLN